jgi:hypothetical protein
MTGIASTWVSNYYCFIEDVPVRKAPNLKRRRNLSKKRRKERAKITFGDNV